MKCHAVTGLLLLGWSATAAPQLSEPTGTFPIGRSGYHWTDAKRPDRFVAGASRELAVYLWYPASKEPTGSKGPYIPGARQMNALPDIQRRMRDEFGDQWTRIVSGDFATHARDDAEVSKSKKRFPVVLFSHGAGSTGFAYTTLIEDLVSHGYVVASIEHTYAAIAVVFPETSRIVASRREPMSSIAAGIEDGAADVRFVLDRLTELNATDARRFPLAGRLDLKRVAAMGHSAGAEFAARACQLDQRFRACVDLDGGMVPVAALPEYPDGAIIEQPLLFLEADHPTNRMGGTPDQIAAYLRKKEAQLDRSAPGSYAVILKSPGIAHPSFSDMPALLAGRQGYPEASVVAHNHDLIRGYIRAFLAQTLADAKVGDEFRRPAAEVLVRPLGVH